MDQHGKPRKGSPTTDYFMKMMRMFTKCYPARLHTCFVLDAGMLVCMGWSSATSTRVIDERTSRKFVFTKRRREGSRTLVPELLAQIAPEALETEYGGTDAFEW